jgi:hypothetical protein
MLDAWNLYRKADGICQVFHQVPHGAGLWRGLHVLFIMEAGQRQDLDPGVFCLDQLNGLDAIHLRT